MVSVIVPVYNGEAYLRGCLEKLMAQSYNNLEIIVVDDMPFSLSAVFFANKVALVPGAAYFYEHRENSIMNNKGKVHREKRHRDWLHAKAFRADFAKRNLFKIPGVDTGRLAYWYRFRVKNFIFNALFFRYFMQKKRSGFVAR